jgi:hypothetical protein
MLYFSAGGASNPHTAGNMPGNMQGNAGGNIPGNMKGNTRGKPSDISYKPNASVNTPENDTHTQYDEAWRTSARVRGAVAQRLLDAWEGQRDGYSDAHFDICEYLAIGVTPEQIAAALKDCALASFIPNHLHTLAVFLGLEKEEDSQAVY